MALMVGGSIWDIGSYPISFIRIIMQAEPIEVAAWQVSSDRGVDLTLSGQMRFPGDAFGQFVCSFQASTHWELEVVGTQGRLDLRAPRLRAADRSGGDLQAQPVESGVERPTCL